jgi:hypothetical protein
MGQRQANGAELVQFGASGQPNLQKLERAFLLNIIAI